MSTINEKIMADLKEAMKAKDQAALGALRALKTALMNATIEKLGAGGELPETEAIAVIRKQIKQRQDSITSFEGAGRADLADKEKAEIVTLEKFLPAGLSQAEVDKLIDDAIAEVGATSKAQMGAVMKLVQERCAGRADGKTLSQGVMQRLG